MEEPVCTVCPSLVLFFNGAATSAGACSRPGLPLMLGDGDLERLRKALAFGEGVLGALGEATPCCSGRLSPEDLYLTFVDFTEGCLRTSP